MEILPHSVGIIKQRNFNLLDASLIPVGILEMEILNQASPCKEIKRQIRSLWKFREKLQLTLVSLIQIHVDPISKQSAKWDRR